MSNAPHKHCRYVEEMALIVGIEENCLAQKVGIKEGGRRVVYVTIYVTPGCLYHTHRLGWTWVTSWMSCVERRSWTTLMGR